MRNSYIQSLNERYAKLPLKNPYKAQLQEGYVKQPQKNPYRAQLKENPLPYIQSFNDIYVNQNLVREQDKNQSSKNSLQQSLQKQNNDIRNQLSQVKTKYQKLHQIRIQQKQQSDKKLNKFQKEVDLLKFQVRKNHNEIQQWKQKYNNIEFNFNKFQKQRKQIMNDSKNQINAYQQRTKLLQREINYLNNSIFNQLKEIQMITENHRKCENQLQQLRKEKGVQAHQKSNKIINQNLLLKFKKQYIQKFFKKEKSMNQQGLKLIKDKIYEIFKRQNPQQNLISQCFGDLFELIHQLIQEAQYYKKKKLESTLIHKQKVSCKNCLEEEANMLYDSCGHFAVCQKCSIDVKKFGCIICRNQQGKYIKSFRS